MTIIKMDQMIIRMNIKLIINKMILMNIKFMI